MALDVVPALNESIETSFHTNVMKDRQLARVTKRIRDGTATLEDGHKYAERLGIDMSKALKANLTAETLPDSTLYYNIAKRTVTPALEETYKLTNEAAEEIQALLDAKSNIGLKSIQAEFPSTRIDGLIDKMTTDGITLEDALKWLDEPIINNAEAFFDDYVDANAKFRSEAGLKTTLTRTAEANACDWCKDLEGTYDYGSAPPDIYRRHEFCRCSVTYQSKKTSQNVWTKAKWESSPEELERRQTAGTDPPKMTAKERLEVFKSLERDKEIADFIDKTGYSRSAAQMITKKKDPQKVIQAVEAARRAQDKK